MGKGVGSVDSWVALVKMGLIFLEIFSLKSKYIVQGIVLKKKKYVPIKVQFVSLS